MSGRPNLRERSRLAVREQLESVAMRLFVENGFEATTVDRIAAEAGISTRSFFRCFPAEEDVVLRDPMEFGRTLRDALEARPPEEPARHAVIGAGRSVRVAELDLADLASVRAFATAWDGPLHLLVNNAGVMAIPELRRVGPGWEAQFATNHLGHFTLTLGLHRALAQARGARIVAVSSSGHHASPVVFDDIHHVTRPYDPWSAYGRSTTANALFAVGATRRWADDGIAPELDGVGGRYLEDGDEAAVIDDAEVDPTSGGVRRWALDPERAERLWDVSLDAVGDAGR